MSDEPRDPGAMVADAVTDVLRRLARRGRRELSRAATTSRRRLEIRQLRRDLDHFWIRLGKTANQLVLAGELDHPALRKAMTRIAELEAELDRALADTPDDADGLAADAGAD